MAPLSKGMVLTARFGTWLEIGARAINWPLRGVQHAAGASLPGGGVVIVIDLTCEQVASASVGQNYASCALVRCLPPLWGGEPMACLFDSVSRQKTYELGSWSGHEPGRVWARLQCMYARVTYPCVRSGAVPARGEFCSSAFV